MMFKHPNLLFLLLILIPLIAWYVWKWRNSNASIGVSSVKAFAATPARFKVFMMHVCFGLTLLAIAAIIVALCRPQPHDTMRTSNVNGPAI